MACNANVFGWSFVVILLVLHCAFYGAILVTWRSSVIFMWESSLQMVVFTLVSSASRDIMLFTIAGLSLTKREKRICSRTVPCGIPLSTGRNLDMVSLTLKTWHWLLSDQSMNRRASCWMPKLLTCLMWRRWGSVKCLSIIQIGFVAWVP